MVNLPTTSNDIIAFSREKDGSKVVVLANLGKEECDVKFISTTPGRERHEELLH